MKTDGLFVLLHIDLNLLLVDLVKSEAPTVSGVAHLLHLYFMVVLGVVVDQLLFVFLGFPHR